MKKNILMVSVLTIVLFISAVNAFSTRSVSAQTAADIVALKTGEQINVNGMGDEGFWSRITATDVMLTESNEYGGHITSVKIKAAHNGTHLFLLATWNDPQEDRTGQGALANQTNPGQYVHNETYYYEDHFILSWWMDTGLPTVNPFAIDTWWTGGAGPEGMLANCWTWGATDTDSGGPAWPYPDSPPPIYRWGPRQGEPLIYPYSWARDSMQNSTGNWHLGTGILHISACSIEGEPFTVRAKGIWEAGSWTLEIARPFTTVTNNIPYSIQFEETKTYSVLFAAFDGSQGEVMETNSISNWMTIELSSQYTYLEQDVLDATQAAQDAAQAADEARKIAETSTTLAYASIAVSVIAIIIAFAMKKT